MKNKKFLGIVGAVVLSLMLIPTLTFGEEPAYAEYPATGVVVIPTEDCIVFDHCNLALATSWWNWRIVDGSRTLLNFGCKRAKAMKALAIIKYYKMDRHCFVGRPDPSFEYWLVNESAPAGPFVGENCVSFNPATIAVKKVNRSWQIVDGGDCLFDFGQKEGEARMAFEIIKKYGFTNKCSVSSAFKYLRK